MWKYVKRYFFFAVLAGLFMIGEVMMDLLQPQIMGRIVDDGVLGLHNGGTGNLKLIWKLGLQMIGLVLFGGFCGSLNNIFVHLSGQNIGNDMRKDCFRRIMTFSFPQLDRFGTGSLVTRVTNDITQVQNFVPQFVRGMRNMSKPKSQKLAERNIPGMNRHERFVQVEYAEIPRIFLRAGKRGYSGLYTDGCLRQKSSTCRSDRKR